MLMMLRDEEGDVVVAVVWRGGELYLYATNKAVDALESWL
jgi:hypothetical protein